MAFIDLLNDDKEALMQGLSGASTPEAAEAVVGKELDRLLYRYQEDCKSEAVRSAAAKLIQTAKASLLFVDSDGETKIWESLPGTTETVTGLVPSAGALVEQGAKALKDAGGGRMRPAPKARPISVWGILFFLIGFGLTVAAAVLLVLHIPQVTKAGQWELILGLGLGGVVASFIGGLTLRRKKKSAVSSDRKVEIRRDAAKIYRALQSVILTIDKQLELVAEEEKAAEAKRLSESAGPLTDEEADLMGSLLEALYSKDSDYALDKLEEVRFYLHKKDIDIVDYSLEKETWFELMPSDRAGTIRPALASGGRLIKKGLATGGY